MECDMLNRRYSIVVAVSILVTLLVGKPLRAAGNRSTYVPYYASWITPDYRLFAYDSLHQQIFTAWPSLDRIDVLSATDYHVIHSIRVASPSSLDISPDGTTLAVATSSAHVLFFDTGTFQKTNDVVMPDSELGVTSFVYTANGNAIIRAVEGLSTGGGVTAYWDHNANSLINVSNAMKAPGPYSISGPLARSGDYSKVMLGDEDGSGNVEILDGNTGAVLTTVSYFDSYIDALAINQDGSRYAICVEPAGLGSYLVILDSSFDMVYQDEEGCRGMTAEGNTLYRDVSSDGTTYTQAFDMATLSSQNITAYSTEQPTIYSTAWQAANGTGVVYGVKPISGQEVIFEAVDATAGSVPPIPTLNDPVHIVRVIDNVGSPQGGDTIRILCTGVDNVDAGSVSVTIGGAPATGLTIEKLPSPLSNLRLVEVKTPAGTPGLADVTLNVAGDTDTATKAFQYAQKTVIFPFSTSPTFLLYDNFRHLLYAANQAEVEVIDPIAGKVLAPLVPASGKLPNSQFAGLSLSPDGKRLYIADAGANLIHVLNLDSPGTGVSINPAQAVGAATAISPGRVFETASGYLVGSDVSGGQLFKIDPNSGDGTLLDAGGFAWNSTSNGKYIFTTSPSGGICGNGLFAEGLISNCLGLWDDSTSQFVPAGDLSETVEEASANADGTEVATGGSTPGLSNQWPEIVDFGLNTMGFIEYHYDVPMPVGAPSFFLNPSGSLLYKAGAVALVPGTTPSGGLVEIDDTHQYLPVATVVFPQTINNSYKPYTNHVLTTDATGRYLFAATSSGITMMVLNTIPLSVGNLHPSFGDSAGGYSVTIRGSGFESGAVASFGGISAPTSFVDENTLTATVPALSAGWQDVTVTNPDGSTYTWPGAFQMIGPQPTPTLTGFSPSAEVVNPTFAEVPLTVDVTGSGFENYDSVEINGQAAASTFVDGADIQVTIPSALTGQTGSITFTVTSPYTGTSNSMALPMVNPAPVIYFLNPLTLAVGSSTATFFVSGIHFVTGSVVQWNGQAVSSIVVGGETSAGNEEIQVTVPGTLLTSSGTATITVVNPSPGGGTSNAASMDVSAAHPVVSYPTSINFGTALLNVPVTQTLQLLNEGSAPYTINSETIGSGPFSIQSTSLCTNITNPPAGCNIQLQFLPVGAGTDNATLTITDNVSGSPHSIPLVGIGTQSLVPVVTLSSIDSLGQTISAAFEGTAKVGGTSVPGNAWVEYGTDQSLATYSQSAPVAFTGDSNLSIPVNGLSPSTAYAGRLVVRTAGGTGESNIQLFATAPARPSIVVSVAPGASNGVTVNPGQTATFNLVASDGGNGYTGTAMLSCSGGPNEGTCTVNPPSVTIGLSSTPFTATVTTTAPSTAWLAFPNPWSAIPIGMVGGLLGAIALGFRKRIWRLAVPAVGILLLAFCFGCGGSGVSSESTPSNPGTPPGTYYLMINATSGGAQYSYDVVLTVN